MTAIPQRRRRRTLVGLGLTAVLAITAVVLVAVAATTLRNSQEGEAVGIDERPVVVLPATPNALVAVEGDEGELTSLVVMTLLPDGRGGTIVTVPVNADANAGVGGELVPLDAAFDQLDFDQFVARVEGMLAIAVERAEVADADRLAELIEPVVPIDVVLPEDVVDSSALGTGIVSRIGEQELRGLLVVDALTATDTSGVSYDHHDVDVAIWTALGANAPAPVSSEMPRDEFGEPLPPIDVDALAQRLWEGPVQVRDLSVLDGEGVDASDGAEDSDDSGNPDDSDDPVDAGAEGVDDADTSVGDGDLDVVVVDRRDSLLVFAQISPALVSTPNPALSFRLEVGFTEEQLLEHGDEYETPSDVARKSIGELLFLQGNVVSVDMTQWEGGPGEVTLIEVADERFLVDMTEFAPILFGESEVEVADTVIDGVDVVVILGTDYLDHEIDPDGQTGTDDGSEPATTEADDETGGSDPDTTTNGTVGSDE